MYILFKILPLVLVFEVIMAESNGVTPIRNHSYELTQANNLLRQERIQKVCANLVTKDIDAIPNDQLEHLIVDRDHKLLYCSVPKVASTTWKRILLIMIKRACIGVEHCDPLKIPASLAHSAGIFEKFNSLSAADRQVVLSEYTRFIIVRHPFERLLSAYRYDFI